MYMQLLIFVYFPRGMGWCTQASQDLPFGHRLLPLLAERSSFSLISSFSYLFSTTTRPLCEVSALTL